MTKIWIDRLPPISFDVGVSIQQPASDKSKHERNRERKPAKPDKPEPEVLDEDEPKHQVDDRA